MSQDDLAILNRWRVHRDAEAFHALVRRYAGMVYATCRRILRSSTEAEDAAQECFEQLAWADKTPDKHVGAWLHRTATNLCLNRLRTEHRRGDRERLYGELSESAAEPVWDDLYGYVDEALAELPDELRVPITRHFLGNETHEVIAAALGTSRRNVGYRIDKGIEEVRKALRKRGIQVAGGALAAMLAANASEAAPVSLLAALGRLAIAGPSTAPIIAGVTAQGAAGLLTLKSGLITAAALAIIGGGLWGALHFAKPPTRSVGSIASSRQLGNTTPSARAATTQSRPVESRAQSTNTPMQKAGTTGMAISGVVTNMPAGYTVPHGRREQENGCIVGATFQTPSGKYDVTFSPVEPDGTFEFPLLPKFLTKVPIGSRGYAYARLAATGLLSELVPVTLGPDGVRGISLTLEAGASITGSYVDRNNRPIPKTDLIVQSDFGLNLSKTTTDMNGRFVISALPPGAYELASFGLWASAKIRVAVAKGQVEEVTLQESHDIIVIVGKITDRSGAPIKAASASADSPEFGGSMPDITGEDGTYVLKVQHEGSYRITASDGEHRPVSRDVKTGSGPADFVLGDPPGEIEGTLTRAEDGKPVSDFTIALTAKKPGSSDEDKGLEGGTKFTKADGHFIVKLYEAGDIILTARAQGCAPTHVELGQIAPPQHVTGVSVQVARAEGLSGIVTDVDGHPIAGAYILSRAWPLTPPFLKDSTLAMTDEQGRFTLDASKPTPEKITAYRDDYPPNTVLLAKAESARGPLTIMLPRGASIEGRVTSGGKPVAGQPVQGHLYLNTGSSLGTPVDKSATTDGDGNYRLAALPEGDTNVDVYFQSSAGTSMNITQKVQTHEGVVSTLNFELPQHNATHSGRIRVAGAPAQQASAYLYFDNNDDQSKGESCEIKLGADGTISAQGLRSGDGRLVVKLSGASTRSRTIPVHLDPYRTTNCDVDFVMADASIEGTIVSGSVTPQHVLYTLSVDTADGTDTVDIPNDGHVYSDAFRISGVPAGAATLQTDFLFDRAMSLRKNTHFVVQAGEVAPVQITLGSSQLAIHVQGIAGGNIEVILFTGNSIGPKLPTLPVWRFAHAEEFYAAGSVDKNNDTMFTNIDSGTYTVIAAAVNSNDAVSGATLQSVPFAESVVNITAGEEKSINLAP